MQELENFSCLKSIEKTKIQRNWVPQKFHLHFHKKVPQKFHYWIPLFRKKHGFYAKNTVNWKTFPFPFSSEYDKRMLINQHSFVFLVEATPRFELGNKGFADLCLTTWLCRHILFNRIVSRRIEKLSEIGGGSRIRTYAWWNQNPLPYRLAIPLRHI